MCLSDQSINMCIITTDVGVKEPATVTGGSVDQVVYAESNVTLWCEAKGLPLPTIEWFLWVNFPFTERSKELVRQQYTGW
jgi:hypothetical protein